MEESLNKQAVRTYLRARATPDLTLLDSVIAADFSHVMLGRDQDRDGLFREVAAEVFTDVEMDVEVLVEEDDKVACRYRFSGTHSKPLPVGGGRVVEPTGVRANFPGLFIVVMRDGMLASGWGEYDRVGLLRQLGAL
jgi:predicted ester cyclase